jgi:magnesium-transporting ATPase (P-type)
LKDAATLHVKEVFELLKTSPAGLASEEANRRLAEHGPNILVEKKHVSIVYKFLGQLKDLFGVLLLFASLLAAVDAIWEDNFSMWETSAIIFAVVLVNALFSLFQEWRAEKAMETLKSWMPEYGKVIRDGELKKILVRDLVPGDLIVLEEGDRVPADARLVEAFDLWTNNVPLTGESEPQPRTTKAIKTVDSAYLDVPNLVFMSTSVATGQGKAVVVKTGMETKFGQIAGLTQEIKEEPSPLQKEIAYTARYDFVLAIIVGVVFFFVSLTLLHVLLVTAILFMIGVMVALVPEGLQVTVSSALAINVLKMARENVLVKRLSAVQTLGSVTVICTDKTGTITTGEMTATKMWVTDRVVEISGVGYNPAGDFTNSGQALEKEESATIEKLLEISALCNSAKLEPPSDRNRSWSIVGDPTDGALLVAAIKYGLNPQSMLAQKPVHNVIPFDSRRKRTTTIHKYDHKICAYTKGAPRSILSICNRVLVEDKIENMTKEYLDAAETRIREFADEGLRVIAVAYSELPANGAFKARNVERDMILVGLVAMKDPPRPEVENAVRVAKKAGIKIVIITGDYGPTAKAIAREVGIVDPEKCRIIRGVDMEAITDEQISGEVKKEDVIFARVSPEQKLRIVKALKHHAEIVAVTGDGANDAPSLKEADIGVAMGVSGTDVAREAADMVLLDDSFASIVKAVESGRTIYENLRKFIVYVFTHNWAELIPYVLYAVLGLPLPLLVVQILAIDLGIEVIPSLALSREPPEVGIMQEQPRSVRERLFNAKVFLRSLYLGTIIATGAMAGCFMAWSAGGWHLGMSTVPGDPTIYARGTTMTFAGIVIAQAGNVLANRTNKASIFKTSLKSNKWIWLGIASQISIISLLIYAPPMQALFGTAPLGPFEWAFLALLAVVVVFAEEIRKWFTRRLAK